MLDYMRESLDIAFKYKGEIDEEFEDTIMLAMCQDILNKYILLIPNEKNIRDSKIIANIDKSKVLSEYQADQTFGLFNAMKNLNDVEQVLMFIKDNSIIVQQEDNIIEEFTEIVKVSDLLADNVISIRHLSRRNLTHTGIVSMDYINNYWEGTSLGENISINRLDFSGKKVSSIVDVKADIQFPERDMHSRGFLNIEDFYFEHKIAMFQHLRNERFFYKTLSIPRMNVYVTNESFSEYFKNQEHGRLFAIDNAHTKKVKIEKGSNSDYIVWRIRKYVQPREFVEQMVKDFL